MDDEDLKSSNIYQKYEEKIKNTPDVGEIFKNVVLNLDSNNNDSSTKMNGSNAWVHTLISYIMYLNLILYF